MKMSLLSQICVDMLQFLRHGNSNLPLVIKHGHNISFRRPFFPPKQEVDITSVRQTGKI